MPWARDTKTYDELIRTIRDSIEHLILEGPAGSGKTELIRKLVALFGQTVLVTATTVLAASHIGGASLNSALGLGPRIPFGGEPTPTERVVNLLRAIDVLVIDEAGMLSSHALDHVDSLFRYIRNADVPMGGVRLILVGDLYQLGPVVNKREREALAEIDDYYDGRPFFFQSKLFADPAFKKQLKAFSLEGNFRQGSDPAFKQLLDRARIGAPTEEDIERLNTRYLSHRALDVPVIGFTNDGINAVNFAKTAGHGRWTVLPHGPDNASPDVQSDQTEGREPFTIYEGARVMATRNTDRLKNGALGTVTKVNGVGYTAHVVEVKFDDGTVADVTWVPDSTYELVLDRVTRSIRWEVSGTSMTFPLRLAGAFTCHRAQGMTLPTVWVDPEDGSFAPGQMYAAISRVPNLEGLGLLGRLRREDFRAPSEVQEFLSVTATTAVFP